jgi:hypothetical protein
MPKTWSATNVLAGYRDLRDAGDALDCFGTGPVEVRPRRISTLDRIVADDANLPLEHLGTTGMVAPAPPGRSPRDEAAPDAIVVEAPQLGRFVGTGLLVEMLAASVVTDDGPATADLLPGASHDDGWRFVARAVSDGLTVVGVHLDNDARVGGVARALLEAGAVCLTRVGTDGSFVSSVSLSRRERG